MGRVVNPHQKTYNPFLILTILPSVINEEILSRGFFKFFTTLQVIDNQILPTESLV